MNLKSTLLLLCLICISELFAQNFRVEGTKIFDPEGNEFIVKGTNVTGKGSLWGNTTITDKSKITDCWKFNTIRIYEKLYTTSNVTHQHLLDVLNSFSASKIVCIVDCHDRIGSYYEGSSLTDLKNYFRDLATIYKDNPYVWFDICNEPGQSTTNQAKWTTMYQEVIKVIRVEVGNDNIILVEGGAWGQDAGDWGTGNVKETNSAILRWGNDVKVFNNKTYSNIVMSIHIYDQYRDGGEARIRNYIDAVWAKGHALVVGEWGNYNNSDVSAASRAFAKVIEDRNVGRIVWHWAGGDNNKLCTSGGGRLINDCTNPTNLSELGRFVWDDNHRAIPTGLKQDFSGTKISVYPNPSLGIITVESSMEGHKEVHIYNALGKIVLRKSFGNSRVISFDPGLNAGLYIIMVTNGVVRERATLIVK